MHTNVYGGAVLMTMMIRHQWFRWWRRRSRLDCVDTWAGVAAASSTQQDAINKSTNQSQWTVQAESSDYPTTDHPFQFGHYIEWVKSSTIPPTLMPASASAPQPDRKVHIKMHSYKQISACAMDECNGEVQEVMYIATVVVVVLITTRLARTQWPSKEGLHLLILSTEEWSIGCHALIRMVNCSFGGLIIRGEICT